jgi:hypothetical protein
MMKNFNNIEPMPNPKPITVQRVHVKLIDREVSEKIGSDIYFTDPDSPFGFIRTQPLQ